MDADDDQPETPYTGDPQQAVSPIPTPAIPEVGKQISENIEEPAPNSKGKHDSSIFEKPDKIGIDRIVELVLSVVIAYFAYSQVQVSKSSSDSTTRQTTQIICALNKAVGKLGDQATATGKQLDAFKKSTSEVALTQATINLPLVVPAGVDITAELENGKLVGYQIAQQWRNDGQTRAVAPRFEWGWGRTKHDPATRYKYTPKIWLRSTVIPGIKPIFDTERLTNSEVDILKAFKPGDPLFAYGRIEYTDIFPTDLVEGKHRRNDHLIEYSIQIVRVHMTDSTDTYWVGKEIPYGYCYDEQCGADYYPKGKKNN